MDIEKFVEKYKDSKKISIREFVKRCVNRKELDDLFGAEIAAGLTLLDMLNGELNDTRVSPEIMATLKELMGDKVDTQREALAYFRAMINKGDVSVDGVISKLKGTLGELKFKDAFGSGAHLAESGSQKGWDVLTSKGEYIQVKMYKDPDGVIDAIKENIERLKGDEIFDGDKVVKHINYAVSSNIYEDLKERGIEEAYGIKLHEVPIGVEEASTAVGEEINEAAWSNFFQDTFGITLASLALHGAINSFLFVFKKKNRQEAVRDTVNSTIFTTIAVGIGRITEAVALQIIPIPPVGQAIGLSSTIVSRATLKRIQKRWNWVDFMSKENERLTTLITGLVKSSNAKQTITLSI